MSKPELVAKQISVRGIVQGVGFRPFIFNLAERFALKGWVLNDSSGVEIAVEGSAENVDAFVAALPEEAPPLAHIESLTTRPDVVRGYKSFEIRHSERQEGHYQLVSPDIATCADCLQEVFDPSDQRYRYPFTNCTNCGPRFTIIADMPYDRPNTTMHVFPMCQDCQREYDDPRDRRFHAQPNACPVCGPQLELVPSPVYDHRDTRQAHYLTLMDESQVEMDVTARAALLLQQGAILAIKGLGGFHLVCDATNASAVRELRRRKRRPDKPFALMMADLEQVTKYCLVTNSTQSLLTSPQCPIVLLPWQKSGEIAAEVAPRYRHLGVMLPYTPLHHILLRDVERPLVMTSGNLTEEPIAAENDEALQRLGPLADAFVLHNRDIYVRYDDAVWFVPRLPGENENVPQPIRRARGYAPFPIKTTFPLQQILACGPEIKNTFCLTRDRYAFVSQHIGDMENLETLEHFERTVELYMNLFRVEPEVIACDLHPNYMATRYASRKATTLDVPCVPVQHHRAHLAACLADNEWPPENGPVIGAMMDGTGYGADGQIWGGEWLVGDYATYKRVAQVQYLPLPGGDAATKNPWRIAFSYIYTLLGKEKAMNHVPEDVSPQAVDLLTQQLDRGINCPSTSSMGRLFDAVSALLGICTHTTYEAQAAIELESVSAEANIEASAYPFAIETTDGKHIVQLTDMMEHLLLDMQRGQSRSVIGWRFHRTMADLIVAVCQRISQSTGLDTVALSGGCFQNRLLLRMSVPALRKMGFDVLLHRQVPCNDGCVSLGQALVAHFSQ